MAEKESNHDDWFASENEMTKLRIKIDMNKNAAKALMQPEAGLSLDSINLQYYVQKAAAHTRTLRRAQTHHTMMENVKQVGQEMKQNAYLTKRLWKEMKQIKRESKELVPGMKDMEKQLNIMGSVSEKASRMAGMVDDVTNEIHDSTSIDINHDNVSNPDYGLVANDGSREILDGLVRDVMGTERPDITHSFIEELSKPGLRIDVPIETPGLLPEVPGDALK
ncbi:PREDICTED: uncharacterized protein LOC109473293 [Branchiostoma belcheri]|uniref:Uncharacterized protein LOC109473293 n=1 Tax=Branchiostoma belcheri TaxID=7741 RepID=A0A6P4ZGE2_BRABE|nr:PREDICTED: uncharacterized protein LOC109473293 [Branchiostoma belcheri]